MSATTLAAPPTTAPAPPEGKPSGVSLLLPVSVTEDVVTLAYRIHAPLIDPRRVLETVLREALVEWKKVAAEWAALAPAQTMLTQTEANLAQAQHNAKAAEEKWSRDLALAQDCSESERIFTEASTRAAVMAKRREKLLETVRVRRQAAEASWKARREVLIKERLQKSERAVKEATDALCTKPPDSFWLRVLNEEVRMAMFLQMGIGGLAGICPL
jgi:hypothetical protein